MAMASHRQGLPALPGRSGEPRARGDLRRGPNFSVRCGLRASGGTGNGKSCRAGRRGGR
ncbi:hypothetical protein CERSUDRAFT_115599 [Gelatoporia subvermispora B]|uniref:Uncharacterized protein n=1 Tax=Ceriporiopsis subvermispora (strain B) TaxID=914234 RepID=M2QHQ4_CERS8|nr:hypothetical protein CERSUDRAFT_115599 [Gelatoporia subvermispora B]